MIKRIILITTIIFSCLTSSYGKKATPSSYVNPGIGTAHSRWFFYTPAAVPFGMAKLAPSTDAHLGNPDGWQAVGYDARHSSIEGFANFHEFQIGGIVIAPSVGKLQTVPGALDDVQSGYRSSFDKKDENAYPGYYSVLLKDYNVKAELTATQRVGFHRYTFPASDKANLIFDIGNRQGESGYVKDASVVYTEDGHIEGWVTTTPVYVNIYQKGATVSMYFSAELDKKPTAFGSFVKDTIYPDSKSQTGVGAGLYFQFNTAEGEAVNVKIGLSYTSIENARLNMKTEAANMNFDKAHKAAVNTWNDYLGRIEIEGGKHDDRVKFYTGLFHALLGRGFASDVNGAYPRNDGTVGQIPLGKNGKPIHHHYNTDAIWGGFWNLTQLWSLAYPEYYSDWVQSQLLVYKDAGWLGDGIASSKYVSGVGTNFTGLAIAAAYNVGIRDFDVQLGYEASLKNELIGKNRIEGAGKLDVEQFVKRGYSPYITELDMKTTTEGSGFSASHTLEYAFSSYAVANFAKSLGKEADYQQLKKLSEGWKLLYDDQLKLVRPKDENNKFIENFDPHQPWRGFQEGNAIQYTFYVPHDIKQLIDTIGKDTFNSRLDSIFQLSEKDYFGGGKTIDAFSGLQTVYNHGNQPNLHISWLFNFSDRPDLTQKWVKAICDKFYGTEEIHGYGFGQDEDQGQLGAWYVMAAMGLFDVKGLTSETPSLQIASPLFDKISIKLNPKYYKGDKFNIVVNRSTPDAIYISNKTLNNKKLDGYSIDYKDVVAGGTLVLDLKSDR